MHSQRSGSTGRTALILVPEKLNYFVHLHGRRLAETLRELGFETDIATLISAPHHRYDWCVLINVSELFFDHAHAGGTELRDYIPPEKERAAVNTIRHQVRRCGAVVACSLDCVTTRWYRDLK